MLLYFTDKVKSCLLFGCKYEILTYVDIFLKNFFQLLSRAEPKLSAGFLLSQPECSCIHMGVTDFDILVTQQSKHGSPIQ